MQQHATAKKTHIKQPQMTSFQAQKKLSWITHELLHNPEQIILQKAVPLDQQSTKWEMWKKTRQNITNKSQV